MDVILQAGMRVGSREIHFAGWNLEVAMNEMHQPVRQIAGKIWAVVSGAVLDQAARHVHARIFFLGELDVRERLVVTQQNIEARLPLLDELVFERQRLFVVVDQDVFDVARVGDQGAGFSVGQPVVIEVAAHAGAQILGLADVDHFAVLIFVEIHAGQQGQLRGFFPEVHFEGLLLLSQERQFGRYAP